MQVTDQLRSEIELATAVATSSIGSDAEVVAAADVSVIKTVTGPPVAGGSVS